MKTTLITCLGLSAVLMSMVSAKAQTVPPQAPALTAAPTAIKEATPAEMNAADVLFAANVTASEVKFSQNGNYKVNFSGVPERKTIWEEDRQNLPRNPQSGVTYRNVGIQIRVTSRFAEIEKIVADAISGASSASPVFTSQLVQSEKPSANIASPLKPLPPKAVLPPKPVIPIQSR